MTLKSGRTPPDNIYLSKRKKEPDLAVLFLFDLSLSTDSYADRKPNDYYKYEGKYGVADVKQALREMHERHFNTYAIAIESNARYYLPQMFGQNYYNNLSHADMLIPSLAILYRQINNF